MNRETENKRRESYMSDLVIALKDKTVWNRELD